MTSVTKIKSALSSKGGVAQGCHYIFTIVPPAIFKGGDIAGTIDKVLNGTITLDDGLDLGKKLAQNYILGQAEHISLLAETCSLPGRQILTTEQRIFGTVRKMPYGVLYEDFTVTFICTNSMIERTFFDLWHQLIMSSGSQYMEYYDNYVGTLIIQKVNNNTSKKSLTDKIVQMGPKYKLIEAYPVSIQAQELNYSDGDYLKLTVQFAYAKWQGTFDSILDFEPNLPYIGQEVGNTDPGGTSGGASLGPPAGTSPAAAPGGTQTPGDTGSKPGGSTNPTAGTGGTTPTPDVPPTANPDNKPPEPAGGNGGVVAV